MSRSGKEVWRAFVDRGLRRQVRLFLLIFAVMVVLIGVQLIRNHVSPLWVLAGLVPGLALGFVLTRVKVLHWEPSERAVVGETDAVGAAILVAYVLFLLFRRRIIASQVGNANAVAVVGLAITAGAMLSRVHFTLRGIRNVLAAAGISIGRTP